MTTRSDGSSSAAQHESIVVLPDPGGPANTIESRGVDARPQERGRLGREHLAFDELVERCVDGTPVNLRMLTIRWPPRAMSPWTMCRRAPSSSCASCRPSVGVELAVGAGGVVEDLGERAHDVVVVVEDLVVVARRPAVPLDEDLDAGR